MKLSKVERLILINQYKILEMLNPEEEEFYALNRKILENGYANHYDEIFEWLPDEIPEEVATEVWDILQMYRTLNFSYENLKDKGDIKEEDLKFPGFDGNEEAQYMNYAKFILHDLNRYEELRDDSNHPNYNSHFPMLWKYRKMLSVWKSISHRYNNNLTLDEIKKILNA
jgi:uncharacterized protein